MILAVTATEMEMQPFIDLFSGKGLPCRSVVGGVGPLEMAVRLTKTLASCAGDIRYVVNFGIGGAYLQPDPANQPNLLDLCLAEREVVGDFGICFADRIESLPPNLTGELSYPVDTHAVQQGHDILTGAGIDYHSGTFVTVNAVTATRVRGEMLRSAWQGLCENMEGAAVARVCREFSVPWLELRCISNFVEDRNPSAWRLEEGCLKVAQTAQLLVEGLTER